MFVVRVLGLCVCMLCAASASLAVEPDEMLDDPVLEARARLISAQVRCPVCQNENIDLSHAQIAVQLRQVVRERLVAGDHDEAVFDYLVARYGEGVLLKPSRSGWNMALWAAPVALLCLAFFIVANMFIKGRAKAASTASLALSGDEKKELDRLLNG